MKHPTASQLPDPPLTVDGIFGALGQAVADAGLGDVLTVGTCVTGGGFDFPGISNPGGDPRFPQIVALVSDLCGDPISDDDMPADGLWVGDGGDSSPTMTPPTAAAVEAATAAVIAKHLRGEVQS